MVHVPVVPFFRIEAARGINACPVQALADVGQLRAGHAAYII